MTKGCHEHRLSIRSFRRFSILLITPFLLTACGEYNKTKSSQVVQSEEKPSLEDLEAPGRSRDSQEENLGLTEFCVNYQVPPNCQLLGLGDDDGRLRDLNLAGADLNGANLSGFDIRNTNLQQSCGQDSNFSTSRIRDASNLNGSSFENSNFVQARLEDANLRDINFGGALFNVARIRGANLSGSCIEGAQFLNAEVDDDTTGQGLRANSSVFNNARFRSGSDFSQSDFQNASFIGARFDSGSNFAGSDFRNANFTGATIDANVNFSEANLSGATWIDGRTCGNDSIGSCL